MELPVLLAGTVTLVAVKLNEPPGMEVPAKANVRVPMEGAKVPSPE